MATSSRHGRVSERRGLGGEYPDQGLPGSACLSGPGVARLTAWDRQQPAHSAASGGRVAASGADAPHRHCAAWNASWRDLAKPGVPSHPIAMPPPPRPDQGLPGSQPKPDQGLPGSQPRPDQGLPSGPVYPSHPIASQTYWMLCYAPQFGWKYVTVDPSLRPIKGYLRRSRHRRRTSSV